MSKAHKITAPASTLITAPVHNTLPFPRCVISRITIVFPAGHVGLTGLWMEYQGKQVLPQNYEAAYRGDDVEVEIYPNLPLMEPPYELEILLFNEDDTYPHSCYLTFDLLLDDQASQFDAISLASLNSYFGAGTG
jgi:hypothetical protein